ncbi:DUF1013 domain-containing protein [Bosea sp. NPDC055594]
MSTSPLMPKATAVWLVENTSLTFEQIAEFCKLHPLEVRGIADGEVAAGIKGLDPITSGQLTREELERAAKNSNHHLRLAERKVKVPEIKRAKGPRYTPVSKRQDRPNAILWLLRNHPELKDAQIIRLVGTTKSTIAQIRDRTHWNTQTLTPVDPVSLGLSSQIDLDFEVARAAKDRPAALAAETGSTLLSAEETTAPEPVPASQPFADMSKPKREEEAAIDVDSVFAKLKQMKRPVEEDDEF